MRLDKAIEIKEIYYNGGEIPCHSDYRLADILSIEAMKRLDAIRNHRQLYIYDPLPGETDD